MRDNPKYRQVIEYIYRQIGRWSPGEQHQLPTEMQIMAELNISRATVQRALKDLKEHGIIHRVQGSGTYLSSYATDVSESESFTQESRTVIPLVIPSGVNDVHGFDIIRGAEHFLSKHSCVLRICFVDDQLYEKATYTALIQQMSSGSNVVIVYGSEYFIYRYLFDPLVKRGVKLIFIDTKPPYLYSSDFVATNHTLGGYMAAEHLIGLGHRRIAMLSSYSTASHRPNIGARLRGFTDALHRYNISIQPNHILIKQDDDQGAKKFFDAIRNLLLSKDRPTAFFVMNDDYATRLINLAEELGLRVPEDLSVVGYDNLWFTRPITTIRQDFFRLGYNAATAALDVLNNKRSGTIHWLVEPSLIKRDTTAPPKI